jgi:putative GTP pyrophosphokinase
MNTATQTPGTPSEEELQGLLDYFLKHREEFELFRKQVADFFLISQRFNTHPLPVVHSIKSRIKDTDHLRDKIKRKWADGPLTPESIFNRITDIAGVRVIHLHSRQFEEIHKGIQSRIDESYWSLHEPPVAYSWDPEATAYFQSLGLEAITRDSYYTSIHYVVKPQPGAFLTCEIQVRTLFEEAWGEIDHSLNYPKPTDSLACREQLRVLAKLASTGTRLADSIFAVAQSERPSE